MKWVIQKDDTVVNKIDIRLLWTIWSLSMLLLFLQPYSNVTQSWWMYLKRHRECIDSLMGQSWLTLNTQTNTNYMYQSPYNTKSHPEYDRYININHLEQHRHVHNTCLGYHRHDMCTQWICSGLAYTEWTNQIMYPHQFRLQQFVDCPVIHPSVMYRKASVHQFGGYSISGVPEDYELWLRWLSSGARMYKLPEKMRMPAIKR